MGKDKLKHFIVCVFVTLIIGVFNFYLGVGVAIGLSIGKEYGDSKAENNYFSLGDILSDSVGIILGSSILLLFIYF